MSKNILCCGLYPALQRTLFFETLRPGGVNRAREVSVSVGGKAVNTARVLKRLGAEPMLTGFCGGASGTQLEALLAAEGLPHALVRTSAASRLCQTLLADDADDITELVEEGAPLTAADRANLTSAMQALGAGATSLVISGTLPPHVDADFYAKLMPRPGLPVTVLLDTSGPALTAALAARPAFVKINAAELFRSVTPAVATTCDIEGAARILLGNGALAVGITQGGGESWLVTPSQTFRYRVPPVQVASTLGCGDAVNAGMVLALQRGEPVNRAFAYGLACGASNAMAPQPGIVDPETVNTLFQALPS